MIDRTAAAKAVEKQKFSTIEAADYLTERLGDYVSPGSLKTRRWAGKEPAYYRERTKIFYRREDLDVFAAIIAPKRVEPQSSVEAA